MNQVLTLYRNAFGGLSKPAWMLSLVMFINRSGSMVVPFMSVYLTESLGFTLKQAGIVLSLFGLGSMCGSFIGGWLTDKIGHFKVQFFSLVLGGLLFFVIMQLRQFELVAAGIFVVSLVTECLRPANSSSITFYAKPENVTRAFSLNRMAINLGFSVGPAIAGLLATVSYQLLFAADGFTCLFAGLFFYLYFRNKKGTAPSLEDRPADAPALRSPYRDWHFIFFVVLTCFYAVVFFQLFFTLPLYYRQVYHLSEAQVGIILALNGFIVFTMEMIVVYLATPRFKASTLIITGVLLTGIAIVLLNIFTGLWVLYFSTFLMSVSEILAMPFMATVSVQRSDEQTRGAYMGLYSLAYSTAFILGPFLGTTIIDQFDFSTLWWCGGGLALFTCFAFYAVMQKMQLPKSA